MKAHVKHPFKKSFILGEEGIRKISEIIRTRVPAQDVELKIYRSDNLVYETLSIEDILKEENSTRNQIVEIEFKSEGDGISTGIEFSKKDGVTIDIQSEDRDQAFLLASDLKEYIRTEIISQRSINVNRSLVKDLIFPIGMILSIVVMMLFTSDTPKFNEEEIQGILASANVDEKLNVILQYTHASKDISKMPWIFVVIIGITIVFSCIAPVISKLYPKNVFYIGKEMTRYDGIINLRGKILWGVIISFIVSLSAGAFIYFGTK
jgi:hypothetical protein